MLKQFEIITFMCINLPLCLNTRYESRGGIALNRFAIGVEIECQTELVHLFLKQC